MTYGHGLFQLAFRKFQQHGGVRKTARAVDVSPSTISRWIKSLGLCCRLTLAYRQQGFYARSADYGSDE